MSRACSASLIRRSSDGITCLNRLSRSRMRVPPRIPAARLNPRTYQWRQGSNRFLCHVCAKRWNKVVPPTPAAVLPKLPSLSASAARAFLHGSGREHRGFPESTSAVDNSKLANAGAAFHSELILPARGRCKATPFDSSAVRSPSERAKQPARSPAVARANLNRLWSADKFVVVLRQVIPILQEPMRARRIDQLELGKRFGAAMKIGGLGRVSKISHGRWNDVRPDTGGLQKTAARTTAGTTSRPIPALVLAIAKQKNWRAQRRLTRSRQKSSQGVGTAAQK